MREQCKFCSRDDVPLETISLNRNPRAPHPRSLGSIRLCADCMLKQYYTRQPRHKPEYLNLEEA